MLFVKPGVPVEGWRVPGFLKLLLSATSVCVFACVSAPKAINYIHVILNLYNRLNKFVAFRNVTKLSMHRHSLCNEARRDRNQNNKAVKVDSFTERVVLTAPHE